MLISCLFALTVLLRLPPTPPASWLDLQEGTVAGRYRFIANSLGVRTTNQLQDKVTLRARFKPLRDDRLALNVGAFSGNSFISSWNNTGIGTGDQAFKLSVKQLYASVQPWREVEAQVGSLYAIRGETTEITNYDNDVYLTGERVTVRAPPHLIVDAITFTRAYVGDFATANVFPRLHRLSEANFLQVLAQKNMGAHASLSGEWSQPPEGNTLHGAVRFQMPGELKDVRIRVESYWRIPDQVGGVGVAAERPLGHRLLVGGGYAQHRSPLSAGQRRPLRHRPTLFCPEHRSHHANALSLSLFHRRVQHVVPARDRASLRRDRHLQCARRGPGGDASRPELDSALTSRRSERYNQDSSDAGWSSPVARWAHNPKVAGSNPAPATN